MIDAGRRSGVLAGGARLVCCALLAIAVLLIASADASAAPSHRYWTSFGGGLIGGQAFVAVDDSNGPSAHDVYVADTFKNRVLKFSAEGEFILMFGDEVDATTGGDVCTAASGDQCKEGVPSPIDIPEDQPSPGLYYPSDLAVDGSAGPTAGDVYVVDDVRGGRVVRFDPNGNRDALWADEGELRLSGAAGVAVDASGRLLVLDLGPSEDLVRSFDPNAIELGSASVTWGAYPIDLEVDADGDLYVPAAYSEIAEFTAGGSRLRGFMAESVRVTGFAVDGASGNVFLSREANGIDSYSAGCSGDPCSAAETFGKRYVNWAGDLAIDEVDKALYAIDYRGGGSVAVFLPASQIPGVTTGTSVVRGEHEADLSGTIDAVGAPAVIGCRFEYVTQVGFEGNGFVGAHSTPCRQSMPVSTQREATARVSGLERGTSYRYRLVVETADRTVVGFDERFETPILPSAQTGKAFSVGPESAMLSGSLESPAARPILKCGFEVVAGDVFATAGFTGARSFPCQPVPFYKAEEPIGVEGQANFLRPGSTYRFRITVVNVDGTVHGLTKTFSTATAPPREPEGEIEGPHHRRPHPPSGKVPCAKRACTKLLRGSPRARVWVSLRFPSSYGWLFEISVDGHRLHHTALENGCRSTFAGHGLIAKLNGCHGRFRIVYRGSGSIRFRWRVFAQCHCAEVGRASASSDPVAATNP